MCTIIGRKQEIAELTRCSCNLKVKPSLTVSSLRGNMEDV